MTNSTVTTISDQTVEKLQELVQINIDSAKGFDHAARELSNASLAELCRDLSSQRRKQADELIRYVQMNGEVAPKDGSFLAAVHRAWMNVRTALSGDDEYAVLAEAEFGEDQIMRAYEEALKETAGIPVKNALTQHYIDVKSAHNRIRGLRDERT